MLCDDQSMTACPRALIGNLLPLVREAVRGDTHHIGAVALPTARGFPMLHALAAILAIFVWMLPWAAHQNNTHGKRNQHASPVMVMVIMK